MASWAGLSSVWPAVLSPSGQGLAAAGVPPCCWGLAHEQEDCGPAARRGGRENRSLHELARHFISVKPQYIFARGVRPVRRRVRHPCCYAASHRGRVTAALGSKNLHRTAPAVHCLENGTELLAAHAGSTGLQQSACSHPAAAVPSAAALSESRPAASNEPRRIAAKFLCAPGLRHSVGCLSTRPCCCGCVLPLLHTLAFGRVDCRWLGARNRCLEMPATGQPVRAAFA